MLYIYLALGNLGETIRCQIYRTKLPEDLLPEDIDKIDFGGQPTQLAR
jgi:hypothetical protein